MHLNVFKVLFTKFALLFDRLVKNSFVDLLHEDFVQLRFILSIVVILHLFNLAASEVSVAIEDTKQVVILGLVADHVTQCIVPEEIEPQREVLLAKVLDHPDWHQCSDRLAQSQQFCEVHRTVAVVVIPVPNLVHRLRHEMLVDDRLEVLSGRPVLGFLKDRIACHQSATHGWAFLELANVPHWEEGGLWLRFL